MQEDYENLQQNLQQKVAVLNKEGKWHELFKNIEKAKMKMLAALG